MLLGQISWLDICVFLLFLAPQLILQAGLNPTLSCGLRALPFLLVELPISFVREQFLTRYVDRSPFVKQASFFEDIVIRCVRYAFAYIPASIGRVFFSKQVALPFLRFRMLRHGYFTSSVPWQEVNQEDFKGIYLVSDTKKKPDVIVYYAHGGGFSMGSSYFYLEFLLVWLTLLKSAGFQNPAIFALEYTLVPDQSHPFQLRETIAGYKYVLSIIEDASRICVSGDSAGATLILSLMLHIGRRPIDGSDAVALPGMAALISPWVTLVSKQDQNTSSDYLDVSNLHRYARQYVGTKTTVYDSSVSPGNCHDLEWWKRSSPSRGFFISYGTEEVFAPEIQDLVHRLRDAGVDVKAEGKRGSIHAWPVAALFLSNSPRQRQSGLESIVHEIVSRMGTPA